MTRTRKQIELAFFAYLERSEARYCVLGAGDIGGDIDIAVDPLEVPALFGTLRNFCRESEVRMVQVLQHEPSAFYVALAWIGRAGRVHFLHPDICGDYMRDGRFFLGAQELTRDRRPAVNAKGRALGYHVPAPAADFLYYLLKKIDKQELGVRHGAQLSAAWNRDPAGALSGVTRFWPEKDAALLSEAAASGNWGAVGDALPRLQESLHASLPRRSFGDRRREFARKLRRVTRPSGLQLAFLGADGSGKSSVIERVTSDLAPAFRRTRYLHLRPGIGIKQSDGSPVSDPHAQPARGRLGSTAKLGYLLFDYTIGWWAMVRPMLVRSTLVIFDRYYHDILVDPRRYRYGGPMWLARWIGKLIPKPDLWILLDAPPEVLQSRKQEVPFEETARQRDGFLALGPHLSGFHVVDSARPLDQVVAEVNEIVLAHLAARAEKRFRG